MEKKDLTAIQSLQWVEALEASLADAGDKRQSAQMSAYMKDLFPFYGVPSEKRKAILKHHYETIGIPDIQQASAILTLLWGRPHRELHYCAQETFYKIKAHKQANSLANIEMMITNQSWWDTVDYIASYLVGEFVKLHDPHCVAIRKWNKSENLWLIRSAILFQLKYKDQMNMELMEELIIPHAGNKEFFIKKAIGWALRQASKYQPEAVRSILQRNVFQPLSVKEASKYL
jgi:3-methyladenine DNA glycosylase AlkD